MAAKSKLSLQEGAYAESGARPHIQHCCWIAPGGASCSLKQRALSKELWVCSNRYSTTVRDALSDPAGVSKALQRVLRALEATKNSSVRAKSDPGLSSLRMSDIVAKKTSDPHSRQGVTSCPTRQRAARHRANSPHLHGKRWSKAIKSARTPRTAQ